jgi:hypothetical protein
VDLAALLHVVRSSFALCSCDDESGCYLFAIGIQRVVERFIRADVMQQVEMDQGRLKRMEHGQTCADVPENARTRLPKKRGGLSRYPSSETGIYFLEAIASSRKPETGQTENSRDFVDTRSR